MAELRYDIRWSNDCDEKFIDDFNTVEDIVFKGGHDRSLFKHQYLDNIYGQSVLVVVYDANNPVAARALWRNDLFGQIAYQPGRTCVVPGYRGRGIFRIMTEKAISVVPSNAIIYNYPNQNSYPGYLKMGWNEVSTLYLRLFISPKRYKQEHPLDLDKQYFNWWIRPEHNSYIRRGRDCYLVKKIKPFCYEIISKISPDIVKECTHLKGLKILWYESYHCPFYSRGIMPSHILARNCSDVSYVPKWKIDAI